MSLIIIKLFLYLKKCRELFLKLSIIFQIFNYIYNNIDILGNSVFIIDVLAIILAIMLDISVITINILSY